jgi:hypothetical protein
MEVSGQLDFLAAFPPGNEPPVSTGQGAEWAPGPVWTLCRRENTISCRESNPSRPVRSSSLYRPSSSEYYVYIVKPPPTQFAHLQKCEIVELGTELHHWQGETAPAYDWIECRCIHLKSETCYICNCRYIASASTMQKTAYIVETCLPSDCIATVAARTPQKASHVIAISSPLWRADCCLATSYIHSSYCWVRLREWRLFTGRCLETLWPSTLQYNLLWGNDFRL